MKIHFTEIETPADKAGVYLWPLPYEATTSYMPGTRFGPQALLEASEQLELWDCELAWSPAEEVGFYTLDPLEFTVEGPAKAVETMGREADKLLKDDKFLLSIGGEHGISYPLITAHHRKYPDLTVVQIDAHSDLRNTYQGSPYSHGCTMRRVVEEGLDIYQIGLRSVSEEEWTFQKDSPQLHPLYSHDLATMSRGDLETYLDQIPSPIYLTFDVDGLDPSVIPGTGTPQPGGLTWAQATHILHYLGRNKHLVGADIVELRPLGDSPLSQFTAAKLAYKLLSYIFYYRR